MREPTCFTFGIGLSALVLVLVLASAGSARALVFEVFTKADKADAVIDGVCADVDGVCTLRAAIQEANAHPGEDIINIIGAKDQTFALKLVGANEDAAATGDLDITDDVIIHGNQHAIITGKNDRVFQIFPGVNVDMEGVIVANGSTLTKAAVADPTTVEGGGILNAGHLILNYCVIKGNKAQSDGGGIANRGMLVMELTTVSTNKALADGGGLYNGAQVGGDTQASKVTFAKNQAGGRGGGVDNQHTVALTNVTLSGNKAVADGGGLSNHDGGAATLQNVTVKGNQSKAKTVGGGIANGAASTATLTNTLVDTNKPVNCAGTLTSGGGNVENVATCGFGAGDIPNAGKLQLKGLKVDKGFGVVATHELKANSPAIDAGIDVGGPEFDANFRSRIDVPNVGTGIWDSGAVEFQLP